jgi:hypothetical protein
MYSDKEVYEELKVAYTFLKKYDAEYALIYLQMRMNDYKKRDGDL